MGLRPMRPLLRFPRTPWTLSWRTRMHSQPYYSVTLFLGLLWPLAMFRGTTSLDTAGGESIEVTRDRYIKIKSSAGESGVVAFDIMATNGVVHIVNSVF